MVEETYGQFLIRRVNEIVEDVVMALPADDDDGAEVIPFPQTLLYGDEGRKELLEGEVYADWAALLPDLAGRMAKEGVLLVLSALPTVGIQIQDPLFALIADLNASFYARGYLVGLLAGADGAPDNDEMDDYLLRVQVDVDNQITALEDLDVEGLGIEFTFTDEGETE